MKALMRPLYWLDGQSYRLLAHIIEDNYLDGRTDLPGAGHSWIDRFVARFASNGSWTAGHKLEKLERWLAASIAYQDAVRSFELRVGHEHMWTAHALSKQALCLVKLNRAKEAIPLADEACAIVRASRPNDLERQESFERFAAWVRGLPS